MKTNKGSALIIALVLLLLATAGGMTYYTAKKKNTNNQIKNTPSTQESVVSHCGMTINSPSLNSVIHSNVPVVISGVIDNTNTQTEGCSWTLFEGEAGTAQLWHKDGGIWGTIGPVKIIPVTNWMTTGPVPFTISLGFDNTNPGFVSGMPMKVVFTEENPSGEGVADSLEFPLIFQ
ncbi:MAG: hypothetical protein WAV23_01025 [Minisyncoccia bacterium]